METFRKFEKVLEIVEQNNRQASRLIPILQAVQAEYRYLPEEVMTFIATSLGISPASVFGVATFYSHFTLKPKGRYHIRVCNGTACHVKHSMDVYNAIYKKLNLQPGKDTTEDMLFTVETVNCIGACGLAPAMVVNEEVYGQLTPDKAAEIIEEIIVKEAGHELDTGRP